LLPFSLDAKFPIGVICFGHSKDLYFVYNGTRESKAIKIRKSNGKKGIAKRRASVFVTNLSLLEFRRLKWFLVADISV